MKKEFVPYEIALELKELGFDEPCLVFYDYNKQLIRYMNPDKDWNSLYQQSLKNSKITLPETYTAPLRQQVLRWFREKHNISCSVSQDWYEGEYLGYEGYIVSIDGEHNINTETFDTYEEAELECIKELIKIVK